jgi:hypothetical protein
VAGHHRVVPPIRALVPGGASSYYRDDIVVLVYPLAVIRRSARLMSSVSSWFSTLNAPGAIPRV